MHVCSNTCVLHLNLLKLFNRAPYEKAQASDLRNRYDSLVGTVSAQKCFGSFLQQC